MKLLEEDKGLLFITLFAKPLSTQLNIYLSDTELLSFPQRSKPAVLSSQLVEPQNSGVILECNSLSHPPFLFGNSCLDSD